MRDFKDMGPDIEAKKTELVAALAGPLPSAIGKMLVDGFRKSFQLGRFNDAGTTPWKEVKRRTQGNPWYGFAYKTNYPVPRGSRGNTEKGRPRRYGTRGGLTSFSPAAATRGILRGKGSTGLALSIRLVESNARRIVVGSSKPYAQVHNEGGPIKVFGGVTVNLAKRQYMGNSDLLRKLAFKIIDNQIDKILHE